MTRSTSSSRVRFFGGLALLAAAAVGASLVAQTTTLDVRVLDGATVVPHPTGTVAFGSTPVGVAVSKTFTVQNFSTGTTNLLVEELVSVPVGFTLMQTPSGPGGTGEAPVIANAVLPGTFTPALTIPPGKSATFTVALNSATPGNFSGKVSFKTNVTGKNPYEFNVSGTVTGSGGGGGPLVRYVDDKDAGFTFSSGWFQNYAETGASGKNPYQGTLTWAENNGTGSQVASWNFTALEPGQYTVAATWVGYTWGATNTPFDVFDGATKLTPSSIRVNQKVDSAGFADAGAVWQNLGTFTITGTTLRVQINDDCNSYPNADGVRIQKLNGGGGTSQTKDDSAGFDAVSGTWFPGYTEPGHNDFQGSVSWANPTPTPGTHTASAWYRFTVTPGTYLVRVGFNGYSWAATNTPFYVYDGDNINLTPSGILVNQKVTPTDLSESGVGWKNLGSFNITTNTIWVGLTNNADNYVFTDAVRVEGSGGGGGGGGVSEADATRLLYQGAWGPTGLAQVQQVQSLGINGWLDQQFAAAATSYPTLILFDGNDNLNPADPNAGNAARAFRSCYGDPAVSGNPARTACIRDHYSMYPLQNQFFTNALYGEDQLRQRMIWALHKIWVISGNDIRQPSWVAPYLQKLNQHAFGNYRSLMYDVTLNPGMGAYLDMAGSRNNAPNENYPRELLQLFTIGLNELNPDGTEKVSGGQPIPTYGQAEVLQITKVFTGWNLAPAPSTGVPNYIDPMRLNGAAAENAQFHDFTQKTLLRGYVQPARASSVANAYADLNEALDNIYANPNTAPYIVKQLIQMLVTSNPSPAYVARVVDTWNRNKTSPNQLREVARAILLDPEARGDLKSPANYGHLKEPTVYVTNLMRLFDARAVNRAQNSDGYLNPDTANQSQTVWQPPSVFSYFPPDRLVEAGPPEVYGPEFGILNTTTAFRRANYINQIFVPNVAATAAATITVRGAGTTPSGTYPNVTTASGTHPMSGQALVPTGPAGTSISVQGLLPLAGNPAGLADELNKLMLHGSMSPEMKAEIVTAVNAVASANAIKRVRTALYLVGTSSQYQVQR